MPYLGYFSLINHVDKFILFDTPQFIRHGWIERNQILKLNEGSFYIKVPLKKHSRGVAIKDVEINNNIEWSKKIIAQLEHYRKRAPYYTEVLKILNAIFEANFSNIVDVNYRSLQIICDYLEINTPIMIWSDMEVQIEEVKTPDEWALNICKALNADSYINPPGGKSFFDRSKYDKNGVELKFLEYRPVPYKQIQEEFVPNMSILDALMFCSPKQVKGMLNSFNLS